MQKHKQNKKSKPKRQHKDTVFVDLFAKDQRAEQNFRSLYTALYGTELDDDARLNSVHIENVLYTNMVNDVSYILEDRIIFLAEHQSTINENMPLRCLSYIERLYGQLVKPEERYKKDAIKIPTPEFFVFYNGREDYPARKTLKLSDAFKQKNKKIKLEIIVEVININLDKRNEILDRCTPLREYSQFIESVRRNRSIDPENGFEKAIEQCMANGILSEYLERKSKEVRNMFTAEYDYEMDIAVQREEAMMHGIKQGKLEGIQQGIEQGMQQGKEERNTDIVLNMFAQGLDIQTISKCTELDVAEIKKIKSTAQ